MGLLFLDCSAGASGDMLLGALLNCLQKLSAERGKDLLAAWRERINSMLAIEKGGRVECKGVQRAGVDALKVDFFVGNVHADHYGADHHRADSHHEPHADKHSHHHDHHAHNHVHRRLDDIRQLIVEHGKSTRSKALATQIFEILALAEGEAHNCSPEDVHFHEVGAFDSILDIFGFAVAFELLEVSEVVSSPVSTGSGHVHTAHGKLGVPTPAVASILRRYELPLAKTNLRGECLTPTGAAILAAIVTTWMAEGETPDGAIYGAGAGTRDPSDVANVVKCVYLENAAEVAA